MESKKDLLYGEEKQNLFRITKLNKYFIFPFLSPIFCFMANFFLDLIIDDIKIKNNSFFIVLLIDSSYIAGGLLHCFSRIRQKTEKKRETKNNSSLNRDDSLPSDNNNNNNNINNNIKIFGIILLTSSILILFDLIKFYGEENEKNMFQERLYFLFFIPLFSKIILKINIYKHQILSLYIGFIGLFLLFIPVILIIKKEDILINIFIFFISIGYSLAIVLFKYLIVHYYISPYLLLLYLGIISIALITIGFIIYSLIKDHNLSLITGSFNFSNIKSNKIIFYLNIFFYFFFCNYFRYFRNARY